MVALGADAMTLRTALLVLALAACATPVPRFDPLPDTQRLPVEYRADAVAGAWSPEGVQPTDAASTQEELAVTEQVMVSSGELVELVSVRLVPEPSSMPVLALNQV